MRSTNIRTMHNKKVCILIVLLLLLSVAALGQYAINWYTIDSGGGTSSGGPYVLTGTIGQPDAGGCSGGSYELLGGFWPGEPLPEFYTGSNIDE